MSFAGVEWRADERRIYIKPLNDNYRGNFRQKG
jgi:hypothetical protein